MCTNFVFFYFLISLTYALVSPNCISISICFQFVFAFILFLFVLLFWHARVWVIQDGVTAFCIVGCVCLCEMSLRYLLFCLLVIDISLTVWPFYNAFSSVCFITMCSMQCLFCFCYKNISSGSLCIVHFYSFCRVSHIHTPRRHIDYYS